METTVRTIYSSHLATCKYIGAPFQPLENSTINELFRVADSNYTIGANEYPNLKYVMIGNGGVKYEVVSENFVTTIPLAHLPRHASLYNPIPFVVRKLSDDLTANERKGYRMRKLFVDSETNEQYVAYFIKVLPMDNITPVIEVRSVAGSLITSESFSPHVSDLTPAPVDLQEVDINNPNGDYLVSSARVDFELTDNDISNLKNACRIYLGDERLAVISEIAVCTGIDRAWELEGISTPTNRVLYDEAIATQVSTFLAQYYAIANMSSGFTISLDVGAVEPMLFSSSNP